jgi:hypothetical protein
VVLAVVIDGYVVLIGAESAVEVVFEVVDVGSVMSS